MDKTFGSKHFDKAMIQLEKLMDEFERDSNLKAAKQIKKLYHNLDKIRDCNI